SKSTRTSSVSQGSKSAQVLSKSNKDAKESDRLTERITISLLKRQKALSFTDKPVDDLLTPTDIELLSVLRNKIMNCYMCFKNPFSQKLQ
ncbi:2524_t:CDS:2, partial [Dentiscutata heterogama]